MGDRGRVRGWLSIALLVNGSGAVNALVGRKEEKAAVIIQAFLRTTLVRVKLERAIWVWGAYANDWVRYANF
jgi:hypothetical protein